MARRKPQLESARWNLVLNFCEWKPKLSERQRKEGVGARESGQEFSRLGEAEEESNSSISGS